MLLLLVLTSPRRRNDDVVNKIFFKNFIKTLDNFFKLVYNDGAK